MLAGGGVPGGRFWTGGNRQARLPRRQALQRGSQALSRSKGLRPCADPFVCVQCFWVQRGGASIKIRGRVSKSVEHLSESREEWNEHRKTYDVNGTSALKQSQHYPICFGKAIVCLNT